MYLIEEAKRRAKKIVKVLALGSLEDEFFEFVPKRLVPCMETDTSFNRLNIITPTLSARKAFGGVFTLLDLPLQAYREGLVAKGWRIRIICFGVEPKDEENVALKIINKLGIDRNLVDLRYNCSAQRPISVGAKDVFLGSMWYHFFRVLPLLEFQKDLNGGIAIPYAGLFQDYEAAFYPWSSGFLLARAMYDTDWPMVHLFNSAELADFFVKQGHSVKEQFIFEPVMNTSLRNALIGTQSSAKERQIIFYGRPEIRRNCHMLARTALEEWSEKFPNAKAWKVVSVGATYPSFPLRNGTRVEVKGKLTLEQYSDQLRRSSVGLSLMSSPHPSYPPLEMAHFGALTVTNSFTSKDLSTWHENIISVDRCDPQRLAMALTEACQKFEEDPECGLRGKSHKPGYLQDYSRESLLSCAGMIERCLGQSSGV